MELGDCKRGGKSKEVTAEDLWETIGVGSAAPEAAWAVEQVEEWSDMMPWLDSETAVPGDGDDVTKSSRFHAFGI